MVNNGLSRATSHMLKSIHNNCQFHGRSLDNHGSNLWLKINGSVYGKIFDMLDGQQIYGSDISKNIRILFIHFRICFFLSEQRHKKET